MPFYAESETPITAVPGDLVIWGPGDPRPTLPIAGWNPGTGAWPEPPEPTEPPDGIWEPDDRVRQSDCRAAVGLGQCAAEARSAACIRLGCEVRLDTDNRVVCVCDPDRSGADTIRCAAKKVTAW